MATLISIPFSFSPNTLIQSSQANSDFSTLANYINAGIGTFAPSGYIVLPGGIYLQWATVATVAADGSAASAVSFPIAFPTAIFGLVATVKNAFQSNPWGLTVQWDTPTVTGFNLNVGGAPTGNNVAVFYAALGN